MQAAAAAAAAVMQGADMPDPFGMTGCWHAAAAAGVPWAEMPDPFGAGGMAAAAAAAAAGAGSGGPASSTAAVPSSPAAAVGAAGSSRAEQQQQQQGHVGHRPLSRRHNAALSTVIECSESPGSSARLHSVDPAATAAAGLAGHAKLGSAQHSGGSAAAEARQAAGQAGAAVAGDAGGGLASGRSLGQGQDQQEQLSQLAKQLQVWCGLTGCCAGGVHPGLCFHDAGMSA